MRRGYVCCPICPRALLRYVGQPDFVAFCLEDKPLRMRCQKCRRQFDANVTLGPGKDDFTASLVEVRS